MTVISSHPTPIGKRIERLRELRGWSQTELAMRAHVNQPQISKVEKGSIKEPPFTMVQAVSKALEVPMEAFDPSTPDLRYADHLRNLRTRDEARARRDASSTAARQKLGRKMLHELMPPDFLKQLSSGEIWCPGEALIVIGATGDGQTTMMQALLGLLDSPKIVVEDVAELELGAQMKTRFHGETKWADLSQYQMAPEDIFVIGEVRDGAGANCLAEALAQGHRVALTLHALQVQDALSRMSTLARSANSAPSAVNRGIVVNIARREAGRLAEHRIKEITQILPAVGGGHCLNHLYELRSGLLEHISQPVDLQR